MVRALAKSGELIKNEMSGQDCHLLHMAVGISGESAELLAAFDSENPEDETETLDIENVVEELGDLEFYLEGLRQGLGISFADDVLRLTPPSTSLFIDKTVNAVSILAGDLLDAVKRVVIYRKPANIPDIILIMAKIESRMEEVRLFIKVTRQDTLDANIAKLGKRYEGMQYSNQAAVDRADKMEN